MPLHHHFGKADDGVQGRAQLVADVGEELGFGAVGLFGGLLGDAQRVVGATVLLLEAAFLEAAVEHGQKLGGLGRFVEIVVGALAHRGDRRLGVGMRRHHHADEVGALRLEAGQKIDAGGRGRA